MIIWGWQTRNKSIGKVKGKCRVCKKASSQEVVQSTDWFDLYFIPIIPYNKRWGLFCSSCGNFDPRKENPVTA
jgi:hypothetical protein